MADFLGKPMVEYVLDAKTYEVFSVIGDFAFNDGTAYHVVTEAAYDIEEPEMLKAFLEYDNQTENLRNITVVSNPGTEKEEVKSIQAPKGLVIGFRCDDDLEYEFEAYADAACTEPYALYEDAESDTTIYVKWSK